MKFKKQRSVTLDLSILQHFYSIAEITNIKQDFIQNTRLKEFNNIAVAKNFWVMANLSKK